MQQGEEVTAAKPRRAAFWIFLVLIELLALILLLEIVLRIARPHHLMLAGLLYSPAVHTDFDAIESTEALLGESMIGFIPRQERCGFVLNSRGFRTPEYSNQPPPDTYRVVTIGDSFAFSSGCVPWEKLWVTQLERRLNRGIGKTVEVVNLGVPGTGTLYQLRLWELEGYRLDPDLVLLAVFVGNDFLDQPDAQIHLSTDQALTRFSYSYRLIRNLGRLYRGARADPGAGSEMVEVVDTLERGGYPLPEASKNYDPMKPSFDEERFLRIEWQRLHVLKKNQRDRFDRLFDRMTAALLRLSQEVRQSGADFFVVLIPDQFQVEDRLLSQLLERHDTPPEAIDPFLPQNRLRELLEKAEIPHLDLLPRFRQEGQRKRLYRLRDTHWNTEGNSLASVMVAEHLADRIRKDR